MSLISPSPSVADAIHSPEWRGPRRNRVHCDSQELQRVKQMYCGALVQERSWRSGAHHSQSQQYYSIHLLPQRAQQLRPHQSKGVLGDFPIASLVQAAEAGAKAIIAAHDLLDVSIGRDKHSAVLIVSGGEHLWPAGDTADSEPLFISHLLESSLGTPFLA